MLDKSDTPDNAVRDMLEACRTTLSRVHRSLDAMHLKELNELLEIRAPHLRALPSWLLLGQHLGALLLPSELPLTQLENLTAFLRLVRVERPELLPLASALANGSEFATATMVEIHLDQLIEVEEWSHPVQVLPRPRSDFRALLAACRRRLRGVRGKKQRARLTVVRRRLERTVRIAESARTRRRRIRERSSSSDGEKPNE